MVRPRKTPLVRSIGFNNPSDLSISELGALSIASTNDLPGFLAAIGWNQGAFGIFTLSLSPDNQRVLNGNLNLVGSLFTLVDNLVSELGSAAQDADTLVANLTSGSGKPYLCLVALVSQFGFLLSDGH